AIQLGAPGSFVYLINADDTVAVRTVKTGPTDGDKVAVLSGLQPGDRVVVDGADKLRDGAKVVLRAAGQGPAPGGPAPAKAPAGRQPPGGQHRHRKPGAAGGGSGDGSGDGSSGGSGGGSGRGSGGGQPAQGQSGGQ